MSKWFKMIVLVICLLVITGCSFGNGKEELKQNVVSAEFNDDGDIVIREDDITEEATFISYEVDGVTIGFIAVRGTDGKVRVAFNTCHSCGPAPNAYFIQEGEYFICQNCKNKIHVDKISEDVDDCSPRVIEEMTEEEGIITISKEYADTFKDDFENWNGPKV